jgi:Cytosol aminopeptidase family, N-terminal domain
MRTEIVRRRTNPHILLCALLFSVGTTSILAQAPAKQPATPGQVFHIQQTGFPVDVLVQGPADTQTELQIICLFHSDPSNTLHGSLVEMNDKLKGLLDRVRTPSLFAGDLGETLLIVPGSGTIPAHQLLIIGLGDSSTFTPARMNQIGAIVFAEASRLGIRQPFFAPTVLDGGVSGFNTSEVAEQFMRGFLRGRATEAQLNAAGEAPHATVESLTFLAGAAHASDTLAGIARAFTTNDLH